MAGMRKTETDDQIIQFYIITVLKVSRRMNRAFLLLPIIQEQQAYWKNTGDLYTAYSASKKFIKNIIPLTRSIILQHFFTNTLNVRCC